MRLSNEWASKWRQRVATVDQRSADALRALAESRRARGLVVGGAAAMLLGLARVGHYGHRRTTAKDSRSSAEAPQVATSFERTPAMTDCCRCLRSSLRVAGMGMTSNESVKPVCALLNAQAGMPARSR